MGVLTAPEHEAVVQQAEWRARLTVAVINKEFDDETLISMLFAGLNQAHEEGLRDAANLCRDVAKRARFPERVLTASVIADSLERLIKLNREPTP